MEGDLPYAYCDEDFTPTRGSRAVQCVDGGTKMTLKCKKGETTCSRPAVANSVSSPGDVPLHRVGDSVNFTCSQGFQLDGAPEIICGPDSQWHPQPPQCLPSPDKTSGCDMPLPVNNANIANRYIMKPSFHSGDEVLYVCDPGYVSVGGSSYRRCINGRWTPLTLRCE
ncbi:hypothetical protein L3Q82_015950, partial [Scortum barcoo]